MHARLRILYGTLAPLLAGALVASVAQAQEISAAFPFEKRTVEVLGSSMAYVDEGSGPVVLFLHGNPTSSYLWRNIIPHVTDTHRAIAVDLIGMGDSAKPDIDYRFETHASYLDSFIRTLDLKDMVLVVHDWGSALGMRYARLNEDKVRALAFMEAIVPPGLPATSYEVMGETGEMFRKLRTPGIGEEMVLENNFFVEVVLFELGVIRTLSAREREIYRRPFSTPDSRIPTLIWPRQIPIAGSPADVEATVLANGKWLTATPIPKLYFFVTPGALNPPPVVKTLVSSLNNLTAVDLGVGSHFVQEDHPDKIGSALSEWLAGLESRPDR